MPADSQSNSPGDSNKVAISMGILVAVIAVIILAVWFTNRMRPPAIIPLSVRNQRRREEELYRKEMSQFILESLPVIRYGTRLRPRAQTESRTYDPVAGVYGQTSEAELIDKGKNHRV
jgi:hypothetical protein